MIRSGTPTTFTRTRAVLNFDDRFMGGRFPGEADGRSRGQAAAQPDEHFFSGMAPLLAGLVHPMPRWSGSTGQEDPPPPPFRVLARALALQSPGKSGQRGISAASSSATRPIAQRRIQDALSLFLSSLYILTPTRPTESNISIHVLMDKPPLTLIVDCRVTQATGTGENGMPPGDGG